MWLARAALGSRNGRLVVANRQLVMQQTPCDGFVVETPALVVWRPAFDANRQALQAAMQSLPSTVNVRPHSKAHKSGEVALIQTRQDGCIGVCAQKLSEAEAMVEADIEDVLVSNQIAVTPFKTRRLSDLLLRAMQRGGTKKLSVCVDAVEQIAQLRAASESSCFPGGVGAMIELDVGHGRCGVKTSGEVLALHKAIQETGGRVYFAGLQAYHGLIQHIRDPMERAKKSEAICQQVRNVCGVLNGKDIQVFTPCPVTLFTVCVAQFAGMCQRGAPCLSNSRACINP
jgi:3-hydroxy-D-aspartate aldolase